MTEKKEMEFETALKKLESIVGHLEKGELSLEEALKRAITWTEKQSARR